ncbi:MAG: aminotransferase class V-fold PLP-dependent enzyme [bacterium]
MIYLDNNATTQVAPEVREAMLPFLDEMYANPSSTHGFGRNIRDRVEQAREEVAAALACRSSEIVFTSGGTESINTAIRGVIPWRRGKTQVLTMTVEHPAVLETCARLQQEGMNVINLDVDRDGLLDLDLFRESLNDQTALVTVMLANNETGVLFPVEEMAQIAKEKGVLFHCDAIQGIGKISVSLAESAIDILSFSGHKFHAPKGIGGLYIRRGVRIASLLAGGGQEKNRRAGTEAVPNIIGLGTAARLAMNSLNEAEDRMRNLRNTLEEGILTAVSNAMLNGHKERRLPNTSNISFLGAEGELIVAGLSEHGVCASSGSACAGLKSGPSHVLKAMGRTDEEAIGSVRFSLSRYTTAEEIEHVLKVLPGVVESVRNLH